MEIFLLENKEQGWLVGIYGRNTVTTTQIESAMHFQDKLEATIYRKKFIQKLKNFTVTEHTLLR